MQIDLNEEQSKALRDFLSASDEPAEVSLSVGDGHGGFGLYVWESEYPEEGATFIGAQRAPAAPSGCALCLNPLFAGTKCKNCGRIAAPAAQPAPAAPQQGYVLTPACVRALADAARKYGQDRVTFGVMEPGAGLMGLPAYVGVVSESVENLLTAAPAAQPADSAMTDEQIEALAHREAWRYVHGSSNPQNCAHSLYTFNRATLLEFARALVAKETPHAR